VQVLDILTLPYFIVLVAVFASLNFPYINQLTTMLILLPIITFYKKLHHLEVFQDKTIILPIYSYLLSLIIYFFRQKLEDIITRIIRLLSKIGAWSYGLYMIHFSIDFYLCTYRMIFWHCYYFRRSLCYLFLRYTVSFFLEKKFQLWIRQFFSK
jgi:peptidoglycan/LPS O-acetylase OafA/YrhL